MVTDRKILKELKDYCHLSFKNTLSQWIQRQIQRKCTQQNPASLHFVQLTSSNANGHMMSNIFKQQIN